MTALQQRTVALVGEVDLGTADDIVGAAADAVAEGAPTLVFDLAGVTFMDSQGLRALVLAHRTLRDAGATLALTGVPPQVGRLLELTGLGATFGVDPGADDGVDAGADLGVAG